MDALISNIHDWLKLLDKLNEHIAKRQIEPAQLSESRSQSQPNSDGATAPAAKSIKNKVSTESLRPAAEPAAHPRETPQPELAAAKPAGKQQQPATCSPSDPQSSDGMTTVSYDSYVQLVFEDLVNCVSAARYMMRKLKWAAKLERLAEPEMLKSDEEEEETPKDLTPNAAADGSTNNNGAIEAAALTVKKDGEPEENIPPLRYMSSGPMQSPGMSMAQAALSRSIRSMYSRAGGRGIGGRGAAAGIPGVDPLEPDVYGHLDKGLEDVQNMCEKAAHQFLRNGNCGEEVANIKRRMGETKELADRELERVRRDKPEALI